MSKGMIQELASSNRNSNETFTEVFQRRLGRRESLHRGSTGAPFLVLGPSKGRQERRMAVSAEEPPLTFQPIKQSHEDRVIVSPGYTAQVLIRWGEPLGDFPPVWGSGRS